MKKTILFLAAMSFLIYFSACRKCYHCHNECQLCIRDRIVIDTLHLDTITHLPDTLLFIDSALHCKDAYNSDEDYNRDIATDTASGYICFPTTPTYQYDFCVNTPGKDNYPHYFDKGGRATCDPK